MLLPLKWGFELLTDGKAIKDHVDRQVCLMLDTGYTPVTQASNICATLTAGSYMLMSEGNMAEYTVLDLRSNHKAPALHDHANLYHVSFAADFESAELRLGSKLLATVHLAT